MILGNSTELIREAEKKAREIIEKAEKEAESIVKEAHQRWLRRAEEEKRNILESATREATYIVSEAKRSYNQVLTRAKNEVIEEVFEKTREILIRGEYDSETSLRNLIIESLEYIDKPIRVKTRPEYIDVVKKILSDMGYTDVSVEGDQGIVGGVLVESVTGVIVDNRIETRLEQARLRLLDKLTRILWGS